MTVVGVAMVFLALSLLVAVLVGVARLLNGPLAVTPTGGESGGRRPVPAGKVPQPPATDDNDEELQAVAVAAVACHRARSVSITMPTDASPWRLASRATQLHRGGWR